MVLILVLWCLGVLLVIGSLLVLFFGLFRFFVLYFVFIVFCDWLVVLLLILDMFVEKFKVGCVVVGIVLMVIVLGLVGCGFMVKEDLNF